MNMGEEIRDEAFQLYELRSRRLLRKRYEGIRTIEMRNPYIREPMQAFSFLAASAIPTDVPKNGCRPCATTIPVESGS